MLFSLLLPIAFLRTSQNYALPRAYPASVGRSLQFWSDFRKSLTHQDKLQDTREAFICQALDGLRSSSCQVFGNAFEERLIRPSGYRRNRYGLSTHIHAYALEKCRCRKVIQNASNFRLRHMSVIFDCDSHYGVNLIIELSP